ncbi:hypothetical protein QYF36_008740 [Acer negundo]|nr:hypothetical protein QYF36_008740 [Acer negundo]
MGLMRLEMVGLMRGYVMGLVRLVICLMRLEMGLGFFEKSKIPREKYGSGYEFDCEDDGLRSFDEFDDEEVKGGQPRNFTKTKYHEFDSLRTDTNVDASIWQSVIYGINRPMMWPKTNDKSLECPLFKKPKVQQMQKKKGTTRALVIEEVEGIWRSLKQDKEALRLKIFNQVKDPIRLKVFKQVKEPIKLKFFKQVKEAV